MIAAILVLVAAVFLSVPLTTKFGRAAGWPLAAIYLVAVGFLWSTITEVHHGGAPAWGRPWISTFDVDLALRADGLSIIFALIAIVIGAIVFAYSARYLSSEGPHRSFYFVMALFTTSMLVLVLADNLFLLFICWELTSMASFILIARSGRPGQAASMRTLLVTFVGGLALLAAIGLIVAQTGTQSLHEALADPAWRELNGFTGTVAALVAIAGFTKAAQFPFHIWLPDAMTAPTPVSAYLHAAAVVKAGIFLLLRFSPAFHDNLVWNVLLVSMGLVTALIGARLALQQSDLKRLMAYSTVSQLGLIVATIGVGTPFAIAAATLHTIAHALFKSGLFMMVGVVDHVAHTRDMRRLPPLWRHMPFAFVVTILGCAAMAGIPPLLGFVSKEAVFTSLLHVGHPVLGWIAVTAAAVASVMTTRGARRRPRTRTSPALRALARSDPRTADHHGRLRRRWPAGVAAREALEAPRAPGAAQGRAARRRAPGHPGHPAAVAARRPSGGRVQPGRLSLPPHRGHLLLHGGRDPRHEPLGRGEG
ncbi:MAG: hypothetical protein EOO74_08490 [Myxococcales bacterium]|nr:MAG: hypothetical protein EOO74_08490 [Myxococcales bacterium]